MNNFETAVTKHYGDADLLSRIYSGLEAAGADVANLRPEDLAPVDEFHLGGRKATVYAVAKLPLDADSHVLDIGCGIGGAARFIAGQAGCRVTGIDLIPEFISTAQILTSLTGLADKVAFEIANALAMPFENETFDAAVTFHVAMNIPDRAGLYGEIARVMKPGATLCIYDVMKKNDEDIEFPMPWAQTRETSHLTTPEEMRVLLGDAGFDVVEVEDRTDLALEFLRQELTKKADGPPPLGIHLVLGATAKEKFGNALNGIESGRIAPVQIIARR
ncbi:MAG: methyltransferase domain-containing protein [Proteobacteria bacterium]|nr:methyltransferase domain-containing protein [Pseudomonadota bacterium]